MDIRGFGLGYSYWFNPGSEPLDRRISNTTREIELRYRFWGTNNLL